MFLVTGVLAGPSALGLITSYDEIELLAHIGIALLLFIVGMRLDLTLIRTTGGVALATGVGQIFFTSAIGFLLALAMGMGVLSAAYVAVALTFSSTIIIVKLLSDKREIDSLHGRIAVGFLIVQDIAAIIALVLLTTLADTLPEGGSTGASMAWVACKGIGLLVAVALLARYVLPQLLRRAAHSQELLALFAVTWAVLVGAASDQLGFSKEVGAFLAGVAVASTPYREAISARLASLRDFLLLFFFVDLGARLEWGAASTQFGNALLLSGFVLVGNPLVVLAIMGFMGYRRRTSFLAGLTVAQISEFSLIVAALGVSLGHIPKETMGLVTLVGVITIFASTYMILYADRLYRLLEGPLRLFERNNAVRERLGGPPRDTTLFDAILVGVGNYGSALAAHLQARKEQFMAVDFDPGVLEHWTRQGVPTFYGDVGDPELYEALPLGRTRWLVSTIRNRRANTFLVKRVRSLGFDGKIALTAGTLDETEALRKAGADIVLQPWLDAAEQAVEALVRAMDVIPIGLEWPVGFREIRVPALAAYAGQRLMDMELFRKTGATVLAVWRGGRAYYDPKADFRVYPGDRLVVMGHPNRLAEAENLLQAEHKGEGKPEAPVSFEAAEVLVPPGSSHAGKSLAELHFRDTYGVSVVGVARGSARLFPEVHEPLQERDVLVVIGPSEAVARFKSQPWLD